MTSILLVTGLTGFPQRQGEREVEREITKSKRERERKKKKKERRERQGKGSTTAENREKRRRQTSLFCRGSQGHDESECGHKICLAFAIFTSSTIHLVFPQKFEKNKQTKLTMEPSPRTKELRPIGV